MGGANFFRHENCAPHSHIFAPAGNVGPHNFPIKGPRNSFIAYPLASHRCVSYTRTMEPVPTPPAHETSAAQVLKDYIAAPDQVSPGYADLRRRICGAVIAGRTSSDGLRHLRYTHEDCIDRILASPTISQNELAKIYGVTTAWMSIVINSDAFKATLAARKAELIDPALAASLNERFGALAAKSVEVLLEKMNQPTDQISDKLALEAATLGAKVMGIGEAKPPVGPNANDHLAAIAHRLLDLNRPAPQVIDAAE